MLETIKAVALDMDGVMIIGKQAVPGIQNLLKSIEEKGLKCMILTNECRYSEAKIRHDLYDMNIEYSEKWPVYTSAMAARDFLIKLLQKPDYNARNRLAQGAQNIEEADQKYYIGVVGEKGLRDSIKNVKNLLPNMLIDCVNLPPIDQPDAKLFLVLGTVYNLDIADLEKALKWIKKGAKVIITCPDVNDPELKGDFAITMPRHILHMVRLNASAEYFSVGKPSAFMGQAIRKHLDLKPEEIIYVGDTLMTDIVLAEESGMISALVLTGNTKLKDLEESVVQPDLLFENLDELTDLIQNL